MTEKQILDQILLTVANSRKFDSTDLTACLAMRGKRAENGIYVLGRALNGWDIKFSGKELADDSSRNGIVDRIYSASLQENNPMEWMNNYRTRMKSAFWRLVRYTMQELNIASNENWWEYVTWSNFYKLSTQSGGNPSVSLRKLQHSFCEQLLVAELKKWQPKYMLFIVDIAWFNTFKKPLCCNSKGSAGFVQLITQSDLVPNGKIVVTARPESRPSFHKDVAQVFKLLN